MNRIADRGRRIAPRLAWGRLVGGMLVEHYRATILIAIVAVASMAVYVNLYPFQMGNNATLVVEVGVGVVIAIILYGHSRKSERRMEAVVYTIREIVQDEQTRRDKSDSAVVRQLLGELDAISKAAAQISSLPPRAARRGIKGMSGVDRSGLVDAVVSRSGAVDGMMAALYQHVPDQARDIAALVGMCRSLQDSDDMSVCTAIKKRADALIQDLDGRGEVDKLATPAGGGGTRALSIAPDRKEYPIGGTIHVRTHVDPSRAGEDVRYRVVDDKQRVVHKSKAEIGDRAGGKDGSKGMFDHRIVLKGRRWKAGRRYNITASQGGPPVTAKFSIAKRRPPIIETDDTVYMAGSDMIITVIDPDSDRDGLATEYVGDGGNSKLVIESDHGKIDGYRLQETGKSTGIFQGIVEILRARADGSTMSRESGGSRIDMAQGAGIDDGFIACRPGEAIRIRYTSQSGSASYTVFASNYSALVETDRPVYPCTGRVRITVVAPDLDLDAERRDTIGDDEECMLSIRTSLGQIERYRLVESGSDTSIFEGSIKLTGFAGGARAGQGAAPRGATGGGLGPDDGLLACSREDELVVNLAMGTGDVYTARAAIRWNIGEITFLNDAYRTGDRAAVRVVDLDVAEDSGELSSLPVHVSSSSDKAGFDIVARETLPGTGIFDGSFLVSEDDSSPLDHKIKALHGDTLTAEYVDDTLPSPYGQDDKTAIVALAPVVESRRGSHPSLERAKFTRIAAQSERGEGKPILEGDAASIRVDVKCADGIDNATLLVNVSSLSGVTLDLLTFDMDIGQGGAAGHAFDWTPPGAGVFYITAYLWESLERPVPLCGAVSQSVNVVGRS